MSLAFVARRHLVACRLRTVLSVAAIALGVGLMVGTQLTAAALAEQSREVAQTLYGNTDLIVRAFSSRGFTPQMVKVVSTRPQVQAVAARLTKRTAASFSGGDRAYLVLAGIDLAQEAQLHPLGLTEGRWFGPGENGAVVVSDALAEEHGLHTGDHLQMVTAAGFDTFTVVGIMRATGLGELNYGQSVFVSLESAQQLFELGARVPEIEVRLTRPADPSGFRAALAQAATDDYVIEDPGTATGDRSQLLSGLTPFLLGLSLISLLVGIFLVYNTLAMAALERRREIGLLRAAGATPRQVARLFLYEAFLLGLAGSAAGVALGYLLAAAALARVGGSTGVQPHVPGDPLIAVLSSLLGLALCLLAAVVPSQNAAATSPLAALRPALPLGASAPHRARLVLGLPLTVVGALALAESAPAADQSAQPALLSVAGVLSLGAALLLLLPYLVPALLTIVALPVRLIAPTEGSLASRSLGRRRGRTTATLAGLALVSASLIALGGLAQSAQSESGRWVDSIFVGTELVVSPVEQDLSLRDQFETVPGVLSASPVSFFPVRSGETAISAAAIEPLAYAAAGRLRLAQGNPRVALLALVGDDVLLPQRTAQQMSATVGSYIPFMTAQGPHRFQVAGILYHSLPATAGDEAALFSLQNAQRYFGVSTFSLLQIIPSEGSRPDAALLRAQALRYGMDVVSLSDLRSAVDQGISALILVLQALALVGVLVALLGIVNTMLMNVAESQREFGLLRAVGLARRQLARLVLSQAALLALAGAIVGAIAGLIALVALLHGTATPTFVPQFETPWKWLALVAAGLLLACLLAALIPARRTARLSIVEAIRLE